MLGVLAERGMSWTSARWSASQMDRARRRRQRADHSLSRQTLRRIRKKSSDALDLVQTIDSGTLYLLSRPEWIKRQILLPGDVCPAALVEMNRDVKRVTKRRIARVDSRIFEGVICRAVEPPDPGGVSPKWLLANATYDEYVDFAIHVANGKFRRSWLIPTVARKWILDPESEIVSGDHVVAVGSTVALVEFESTEPFVVLHRRSSQVFTEPGMVSLLPVFGVEPNRIGGFASRLGLLQHNFLRELGEELFGVPELVGSTPMKSYDPDWFLSHPAIAPVLVNWEIGAFDLYYLGAAIDVWNPSVHFSLVAVARSGRLWSEMLRDSRASWEIAVDKRGYAELAVRPMNSPETIASLRSGSATETTRFTFDLVRQFLGI